MTSPHLARKPRPAFGAFVTLPLAACLAVSLAGCMGGVADNRTLYSEHQPVVHKEDFSLDLRTQGNGLAYGEAQRLSDWFGAVGIKYGDRIFIDDASASPAVHSAVATVAQRFGAALDTQAPISAGYVEAGTVRVIITRFRAQVPGCPDWKDNSDSNPGNATSSNYGCAVNSNLAAMVANPEDLVRGQTNTGSTVVMTSNRAIDAYRKAAPTGNGNSVDATSSKATN